MGITHSGAHTKGCLGWRWLGVGVGGGWGRLTRAKHTLVHRWLRVDELCLSATEPSVSVERVLEPVPAVLLRLHITVITFFFLLSTPLVPVSDPPARRPDRPGSLPFPHPCHRGHSDMTTARSLLPGFFSFFFFFNGLFVESLS